MDLLDGPPLLSSISFLFLTELATITQARSVISLTLSARTTHHYNTCMHTRSPPGVSWSLAYSVLAVTHYCHTSSLASLSSFSRLVFYSILGDYTRVLVRPVSILLTCFLLAPVFRPPMSRREAVEEEILYKCTLYPFRLLFLSPRSLPVFFFICDNSSLPCAAEQVVSLFMHSFFFCKRPSFLSPFLHPLVSRSYIRLIYPRFLRVRALVPRILCLWKYS